MLARLKSVKLGVVWGCRGNGNGGNGVMSDDLLQAMQSMIEEQNWHNPSL
jgi:hypothetical protein